jgi:diaminohydroxyphosphoribosylaminopyrimidine deaminase/5-amino-6-(5-phosphoribosylamino)uracil reductase
VVVGALDPFPQVNGGGIERLRAAGVEVVLAEGSLRDACRDINIGFFSRFERGRPWVRLKVAASMDGYTALPDGQSQWITGPAARADGHAWRRRASAVVTGVGTLLADDPAMNVRLVPCPEQPVRIVLDSKWRTPPDARVFQAPGKVLVVGVGPAGEAGPALRDAGADLLELSATDGRVDLSSLLRTLAARGVNELHVEAGATLNGALLAGSWADELLIYIAPKLLGAGRAMAGSLGHQGPAALAQAPGWRFLETQLLEPDLRIRVRRSFPVA